MERKTGVDREVPISASPGRGRRARACRPPRRLRLPGRRRTRLRPRGDRTRGASTMSKERVRRLQAELQEPLLVTGQRNVRYLTGFDSSNAAVLVELDRVRLFAD